jgi:fermentation-respiration switch protein FrsA (DUF1100 family)
MFVVTTIVKPNFPEEGLSSIEFVTCDITRAQEPAVEARNVLSLRKQFLLKLGAWLFFFLAILGPAVIWSIGSAYCAPANRIIGGPPEELGMESVSFPSESGATLFGWFKRGEPSRGAVVLVHGIRGDRLQMLGRARLLAAEGMAVLLFDLQAHGESQGNAITFGWLESRDVQAAVKWMRAACPNEKVGVIGSSLGGAAAVLASPPLKIEALVLEAVFPTIEQATSNRIESNLWGIGGELSPLLTLQLKFRFGISAKDLHPIDKIGAVTCPKLIIGGGKDPYTPPEETQELLLAAKVPRELWIVPDAGHQDFLAVAPEEYRHRVVTFLKVHLKPDPPKSVPAR